MISAGRFQPPSRQLVVYGEALETALPRVLKDFWAVQTIAVTNRSLAENAGIIGKVEQIVGEGLKNKITGVRRDAPREDVVRVTEALRSKGIDSVVAVGGGSVIDTVKAARICLTNNVRDVDDMDRLRHATTAAAPRPYLIAIPTTLSGAEYTQFAGVFDQRTGKRDRFHHLDLAPDAVILDPAFTRSTPRDLWLSSGMHALDHALETWCSDQPTPYSDATSLYAARVLLKWLPATAADPEDDEARLACQVAAWMAIQGSTIGVRTGVSHALGRIIAGKTNISRGVISAIILPHALAWDEENGKGSRQLVLSQVSGSREQLAELVAALAAELGLPSTLQAAGVDAGCLQEILKMVGEMQDNPDFDAKAACRILESAA